MLDLLTAFALTTAQPKLEDINPRPALQLASQQGTASWYGGRFHGRTTASGELYNMWAMTAAHRYLPLGTTVRVTNLRNGRSVVVRINDRGPYVGGRIIDLSKKAAARLGMIHSGTAPVQIEVIN